MGRHIEPRKRILGNEGEWLYTCRECKNWFPAEQLGSNKALPYGVASICKPCNKKYRQTYNDKRESKIPKRYNKEFGTRFIENIGKVVMFQYLSDEDYDETLEFFERIGYDKSKSIHEQFINKIEDKYGRKIPLVDTPYQTKERKSALPPKMR